jgi:hypothetical protein
MEGVGSKPQVYQSAGASITRLSFMCNVLTGGHSPGQVTKHVDLIARMSAGERVKFLQGDLGEGRPALAQEYDRTAPDHPSSGLHMASPFGAKASVDRQYLREYAHALFAHQGIALSDKIAAFNFPYGEGRFLEAAMEREPLFVCDVLCAAMEHLSYDDLRETGFLKLVPALQVRLIGFEQAGLNGSDREGAREARAQLDSCVARTQEPQAGDSKQPAPAQGLRHEGAAAAAAAVSGPAAAAGSAAAGSAPHAAPAAVGVKSPGHALYSPSFGSSSSASASSHSGSSGPIGPAPKRAPREPSPAPTLDGAKMLARTLIDQKGDDGASPYSREYLEEVVNLLVCSRDGDLRLGWQLRSWMSRRVQQRPDLSRSHSPVLVPLSRGVRSQAPSPATFPIAPKTPDQKASPRLPKFSNPDEFQSWASAQVQSLPLGAAVSLPFHKIDRNGSECEFAFAVRRLADNEYNIEVTQESVPICTSRGGAHLLGRNFHFLP